jgi:hypothetical protein
MVNTALILCEGGDDVGFLNKFCKEYLKLDMNKLKIQKIGENNDKNGKSAFWEESTYQVIKQEVNSGQ